MSSHAAPSKFQQVLRNGLSLTLAVPVVVIIILAIVTAVASMMESIHFAHATDQIINVVAAAHDFAAHEKNFAQQPGEDLLSNMGHNGLITGVTATDSTAMLTNPWGKAVRTFVVAPSIARVEVELPTHDCRRMALFFARSEAATWLQSMEAREGTNGGWRRFYDNGRINNVTEKSAEVACGLTKNATLAMAFRLR